jgi:hypothetical protein
MKVALLFVVLLAAGFAAGAVVGGLVALVTGGGSNV